MVGRAIKNQGLPDTADSQDLLDVVVDYTYALDTLDNYDYERLSIDKTTKEEPFYATYENAMEAINALREKFGGSALFGKRRMIPSKAASDKSTRPLEAKISIRVWKKRPPCCSIS